MANEYLLNLYCLDLAINTPLPPEGGRADSVTTLTTIMATSRPFTRSQAALPPSTRTSYAPPTPLSESQNRKRKTEFKIFEDANTNIEIPTLSPKRSRASSPRSPLSIRTDSGNSTPAPSPRLPDTPFSISSADLFWEDIENYDLRYMTPPATPGGPSLPPTPSAGPPPSRSSRVLRPRARQVPAPLAHPVNMIVYHMLKLKDWNVSRDAIKLAYRRVAFANHPDMVAPREKEFATLAMQQINAARDLLLDARRRHKYHRDGIVPWVV